MSGKEIRFLTAEEILFIHFNQIELYGGAPEIRDRGLLESAMAQPSATFMQEYLHADLFIQAAAYLFHLCQNHPFLDGNKRTGLASALVFLDLNGFEVDDPENTLYDLVISVAEGKTEKMKIAEILQKLSKPAGNIA